MSGGLGVWCRWIGVSEWLLCPSTCILRVWWVASSSLCWACCWLWMRQWWCTSCQNDCRNQGNWKHWRWMAAETPASCWNLRIFWLGGHKKKWKLIRFQVSGWFELGGCCFFKKKSSSMSCSFLFTPGLEIIPGFFALTPRLSLSLHEVIIANIIHSNSVHINAWSLIVCPWKVTIPKGMVTLITIIFQGLCSTSGDVNPYEIPPIQHPSTFITRRVPMWPWSLWVLGPQSLPPWLWPVSYWLVGVLQWPGWSFWRTIWIVLGRRLCRKQRILPSWPYLWLYAPGWRTGCFQLKKWERHQCYRWNVGPKTYINLSETSMWWVMSI